ncbi:hypothetical protein ACIXK3_03360 [Bacteroides fragilis]
MRNEENPRAGGSETGDAAGKKVAGFLKNSVVFFNLLIVKR